MSTVINIAYVLFPLGYVMLWLFVIYDITILTIGFVKFIIEQLKRAFSITQNGWNVLRNQTE